ncbi:MAG: hypothetical protein HC837_13730 [Chloroflexaceae bacterium]|nr:hypothetical protein [Chloroflexaceae bacterium]
MENTMGFYESKKCYGCGSNKPLTDFRYDDYGWLNRYAWCKTCETAFQEEHAQLEQERMQHVQAQEREEWLSRRRAATSSRCTSLMTGACCLCR